MPMCACGQSIYIETNTGDRLEGEDLVQFRLLYSGRLLGASKSNTRADLKHQIRMEIHPQLRRLWITHPALKDMARYQANDRWEKHPLDPKEYTRPDGSFVELTEEDLEHHGRLHIAEKWERGGRGFIPLVTEELCLRSSIEILFLRPEGTGTLIKGGDLDNRIKTIFDALRLPHNASELPDKQEDSTEEDPIFVLLEDDKLISEVRVITDQLLLLPKEKEIDHNDVFLVIVTLPSERVAHKRTGFGLSSDCGCTFASGCEGEFSSFGLLLESRRAEVVQSRVHP
jgi:hypothetical protein